MSIHIACNLLLPKSGCVGARLINLSSLFKVWFIHRYARLRTRSLTRALSQIYPIIQYVSLWNLADKRASSQVNTDIR
jgi:predicted LPLAT superfamily acyltransferase